MVTNWSCTVFLATSLSTTSLSFSGQLRSFLYYQEQLLIHQYLMYQQLILNQLNQNFKEHFHVLTSAAFSTSYFGHIIRQIYFQLLSFFYYDSPVLDNNCFYIMITLIQVSNSNLHRTNIYYVLQWTCSAKQRLDKATEKFCVFGLI